MAVRGSGIGAGWAQGSVWGSGSPQYAGRGGQSPTSQATQQATQVRSIGLPQSPSASLAGSPSMLLVLVFAEALGMIALRRGFRHSHGG